MTKQSFTVIDQTSGTVIARGLTAVQAMTEILTDDGYRYEIRPGDPKFGGFDLWHSDGSEASTRGARHMVKTVVFSFETDAAKAEEEIALKVIAAGWPRLPEAMTDETYDERQAEIAADADDTE